MDRINLEEKFAQVGEHWSPKLIGELNGQYVKLAKGAGELVWHAHAGEDEFFLVVKGRLQLHFRDRVTTLDPGECCIVPRGVEHKPVAEGEVQVLLFEPKSTQHTGEVDGERTVAVEDQEWI